MTHVQSDGGPPQWREQLVQIPECAELFMSWLVQRNEPAEYSRR
jgi:hypothetical protein